MNYLDLLQKSAEEHALLVSMHEVVAFPKQQSHGPQEDEDIQDQLQPGRPDLDGTYERKTRDAIDLDSRDVDILALPVGQEVDFHAEIGGDHGSVIDTEGGSSR